MKRRIAYITAFALLAAAAAVVTLRAQHVSTVVIATHDLRAGVAVQAGDVEVRRIHDDGAPAGSLATVDDAVGQYTAWPLTAGEPVLARMLHPQRSGGAATAGLDVPRGYRAVAVPVQPAAAVGGMLTAGDRVDVFATPLAGHTTPLRSGDTLTPPDPVDPANNARSLGRDVLVLQLRTDQGQMLDSGSTDGVHGLDVGAGKLGSVVLAVPDADVAAYAAAVANDSIYLALSVS